MTNTTIPSPFILETERMYLRLLSPEVYGYLFTNCSDKEIKEYFGFTTEEELNAEKEKYSKGYTTYFVSFANFHLLDKQSGRVLGSCGYHTWIPKHRRAEVGYYLLHDQDKGKGLMTEALGPILRYGFEQMKLHRIEALLADYNTPSVRLLKRFGFKDEGTVRGHYVVDGINEDSVLVSLLLPEYEQLKSSWNLAIQPVQSN
ncbi:GNAT family N-acetyltransferase [Pontibacter cellulosilyticus]|uniref:GNAT family N-acetyltransferase n=1 Tax=Pontibacter cellulosilyticus TaxID=1720253 RepID=A0A923N8T0_9BACT|nr:GNAT family protein [Pontibacter cellulosilyticus]MBC5995010.1 GNAT family N-acetyltransferase [Pontibacter cellulosilyticus]